MQEKLILENKIERGDFARGGETSSNLKELLRKLGIPSDKNRRITIVAYELEMNIIIHSYGGEIKVYISSEQIKVVAADSGPGIEDLERPCSQAFPLLMMRYGIWVLVLEWV